MSIRKVDPAQFAAAGFMTEAHAVAAHRVCQSQKLIITCRKTGTDSLDRLRRGHPAKGHDILAKSIKPGSLESLVKDPKLREHLMKELKPFFGLVGVWEKRGKDEVPVGFLSIGRDDRGHFKEGGVRHDFGANTASVAIGYTGDYDLHDLLWGSSGCGRRLGAPIASESPDQWRAIRLCNTAMLNADPQRLAHARPWGHLDGASAENWHNPYSPFRHGPQRSYWAFALADIEEKDIVMAVVGYDAPIGVLHVDGNMYILDTVCDIREFYRRNGDFKSSIWDVSVEEAWLRYGNWLFCRWRTLGGAFGDKLAAWGHVSHKCGLHGAYHTVMKQSSSGKKPGGMPTSDDMDKMGKALEALQKQTYRMTK